MAMQFRSRAGRSLRLMLAASLTACLSLGIASAVPTGTSRAHSCCPAPKAPSAPAKTTAGVPRCCLVVTPSQAVRVVVVRALLPAALGPSTDAAPPLPERGPMPSLTDLLYQFLNKAVLATRAPPRV